MAPFPGTTFRPLGPLEELLLEAVRMPVDQERIIAVLLGSRLWVPTRRLDFDAAGRPRRFQPFLIRGPGGLSVVAFSSLARCAPFRQRRPECREGLVVAAPWVLRSVAPSLGLYVNPGWREGLAIPPDVVLHLRFDRGLG